MKRPETIVGAIYDVDDTLLNNQPVPDDPVANLHQISRLEALRSYASQMGGKYTVLSDITPQENFDAFERAPVHTVGGAIYILLRDHGLVTGEFDNNNKDIREITRLKNISYSSLIVDSALPVEGADTFVQDLSGTYGLANKNAIASAAVLTDIQTFLCQHNLSHIFPSERIIDISKTTKPKPDPEPFNKAFLTLGLPDSERGRVVAFEDDPRGMLSARKAGLFVCAITTRYSKDTLMNCVAKPDFIAESYAEMSEFFNL